MLYLAQEHASFIVQEQKRKEAKGRRAYEHWLQEVHAQKTLLLGSLM
jgi:hypothetical protein